MPTPEICEIFGTQDVLRIGVDRVNGSESEVRREHHDGRLRRVNLPDRRGIRDVLGQVRACRIDRREHILGGAIDVAESSNWTVSWVTPSSLDEVSWVRPGICD